jgi:hypothetical protein
MERTLLLPLFVINIACMMYVDIVVVVAVHTVFLLVHTVENLSLFMIIMYHIYMM